MHSDVLTQCRWLHMFTVQQTTHNQAIRTLINSAKQQVQNSFKTNTMLTRLVKQKDTEEYSPGIPSGNQHLSLRANLHTPYSEEENTQHLGS